MGSSRSFGYCGNKFKDCHIEPCKGNSDNAGWFHPQLAPMDALSPHHPFGYNQKRFEKSSRVTLFFLRWKTSCVVGVEADSELLSELIFSGRSRSRSQSRLKFVDSAALLLPVTSQLLPSYFSYFAVAGINILKYTKSRQACHRTKTTDQALPTTL